MENAPNNMVKNITISSASGRQSLVFSNGAGPEIVIPCAEIIEKKTASFDIEIVFSVAIRTFRNHDYTWADCSENRVANTFSPKIIQLDNGYYVQSNSNQGIWEVEKNNPKKLLWRFHPEFSEPLAQYSGPTNQKIIGNATPGFASFITPALLFSDKGAVELSRSLIPFVATACFTDHCDFDTLENLQKQRDFFKKHQIRTTKGFFLNHFSKRADNASWEKDAEELRQWKADGHELCYHSLSQSIKSREESQHDFFNFLPPFDLKTWIDHGYQPYNLSLYQKEGLDEKAFAQNLADKKIAILWNYIDSGTATSGVLNQLNPQHFTLQAFRKGISGKTFKKRLSLSIKNAIVHYYADEKLIKKYAQLASSFKKKAFLSLAGNVFKVGFPLFKLWVSWPFSKKKTYPLARYQNLFFEHTIAGKKFVVFQTLELLDFVKALKKESLDAFISEKGLFVGHTYFSVPMTYHDGRIFNSSGAVQAEVSSNFAYLGQQIEQQKLWNPTLEELVSYWKQFNEVIFELAENGQITIKNANGIPHRNIT